MISFVLLSTPIFLFDWYAASDDRMFDAPTTITPKGGLFSAWIGEDDAEYASNGTHCDWWDGNKRYKSDTCNSFAITRLSSQSSARAIRRATECAKAHATTCVLNAEIGFDIPSAFVYDDLEGIRMIVAPRLLPLDFETDHEASDSKMIRLQHPSTLTKQRVFVFNNTVKVEFLAGGTRGMLTEIFKDNDAYCVQALRKSIDTQCWEGID